MSQDMNDVRQSFSQRRRVRMHGGDVLVRQGKCQGAITTELGAFDDRRAGLVWEGTVIAHGYCTGWDIEPGDCVIYPAGEGRPLRIEGEEYLLLDISQILLVIAVPLVLDALADPTHTSSDSTPNTSNIAQAPTP